MQYLLSNFLSLKKLAQCTRLLADSCTFSLGYRYTYTAEMP